jgi:carboxyl-terminal processing protease
MVNKDALKLTTAKYFTPSGRCIHKDRPRDEEEFAFEDAPPPVEEKKVEAPRQEFHTSGGRIVYGGGGITPDWTITLPNLTEFEVALERRQLFFNFAVHYAAQHKVDAKFEADDAVVADFRAYCAENKDFRAYCAENKFAAADSTWTAPENVDYMKLAIKREVFRKLMGVKGAYLATLPKDEEVNKVLAMFHAAPTLKQMFEYVDEQTKAAETAAASKKTEEAPKK